MVNILEKSFPMAKTSADPSHANIRFFLPHEVSLQAFATIRQNGLSSNYSNRQMTIWERQSEIGLVQDATVEELELPLRRFELNFERSQSVRRGVR